MRGPKALGCVSCSYESPSFAVEPQTDPAVNQVSLVGKKRSVLNGDYDLDFHPSGTSISKVLCCWNTNECLGFDIPERIKNLILQHV